jgi:hypothetical protein
VAIPLAPKPIMAMFLDLSKEDGQQSFFINEDIVVNIWLGGKNAKSAA